MKFNVDGLTNSCRIASAILSLTSGDPLGFIKSMLISEVKYDFKAIPILRNLFSS